MAESSRASERTRWPLGVVGVAIAATIVAVGIAVLRDGASSSPPEDLPLAEPLSTIAAVGEHGVPFDHQIIDANPPSGTDCCLDVITAGDIDADGRTDVIVGSEHADGWSWYHNPGEGSTSDGWDRHAIGEGDFTTDGQASDLDGDGDLDIVISSISRAQVEWWEQIGDPTAGEGWVRHDIGPDFAHDVLVADIDGDGDLDVAAMHYAAGRIAWYEAPDDPADEWTTHEMDARAAEGIDAADLDGDGDLDLVAGPSVYLNDDGVGRTWTSATLATDWSEQARSAIGDVDGDGVPDIVLSHGETEGRLSWFQGPDWPEHVIEADAGFSHSLEVGDVDLDGHVDVMVGVMHGRGTQQVRVLLGDGGSTWTPLVLGDQGTHNAQLVDLDGDGRLDVVGKNYEGPKQVEVWWNRAATASPGRGPDSSPLDGFRYVQVDDDRGAMDSGTPYFGLNFGDLDLDGDVDIVSGGYVYVNPGGDMSQPWDRVDLREQLGSSVDAMLVVDVDHDADPDVIATALPDVWWLESSDGGRSWTGRVVASVPATPRPNGQGYRLGDLNGDGLPEIVLSGGSNESDVWYVEIPSEGSEIPWPTIRITATATDEQVGIGDIDGDGDNDVAAGDMRDGGQFIAWFENPADGSADWVRHRLGVFDGVYPDRLDLADLNGDGRLDVVVSEENPGSEPDAEVSWYQQPADPTSADWPRTVIVTQYTTNGLDVGDLDGDGDPDLVTGEHRGTRRLSIWENVEVSDTGAVVWQEHPVDEGKESHLGARVADLDLDGDFEIVSIGWDEPEYLHLWVND